MTVPSSPSTERLPAHAAFRNSAPTLTFAALLAEAGVLWAVYTGSLTPVLAIAAHVVVVACLGVALAVVYRSGRDCSPLLLLVPAVAFAGPFGAFGGLLIGVLSQRGASDVVRLEDWYERLSLSTALDPTARLADHVITGRALNVDLAPAGSMASLIAEGTISEKQGILGLIARKFHPDYLPALQAALIAEEPVIRVQAAAVAAKIRGEMPALVDTRLKEASDATTPAARVLACVVDVRRCAASGLLEARDKERAERLTDGLLARTMLRLERAQATGGQVAADATVGSALEQHLLQQGRHAAFRHLRRSRTWALRGPYLWRGRPWRARLTRVA